MSLAKEARAKLQNGLTARVRQIGGSMRGRIGDCSTRYACTGIWPLRADRRHFVQRAARFPTRASNERLAVRPRHLNRNREDLGKRTNRPASGHVLV